MGFDLNELQAFVAVADKQSFRVAAEALHLSQPALSRRIERLEAALGTPLLARTTRKVALTPTGARFLEPARAALDGLQDAVLRLAGSAALRRGQVTVACIPSVAQNVLPPLLARFAARFPGARLSVIDDSATLVLQAVQEGRADFGVGFVGAQEPDLRFTAVGREPYVLAMPRQHPWASRRAVRWAELAGQKMVTLNRRSANRVLVDQALAALAEPPLAFYEAEHVAGAMALVEAGLGLAALPRLALPLAHPRLVGVALQAPQVERVLGLITPASRPLPPAAQVLHDMLGDALPAQLLPEG